MLELTFEGVSHFVFCFGLPTLQRQFLVSAAWPRSTEDELLRVCTRRGEFCFIESG